LQSPADISWGPDILVQPDLFVVGLREAQTLEWDQMKTLLLVVEVLSLGTARHDRFAKRRLCQEVGVPLYWIVDPDQQSVEVWTPEGRFPSVERERVVWKPNEAEVNVFDARQRFLFSSTTLRSVRVIGNISSQ
jgi:Uma2 family endonuclease